MVLDEDKIDFADAIKMKAVWHSMARCTDVYGIIIMLGCATYSISLWGMPSIGLLGFFTAGLITAVKRATLEVEQSQVKA